MIIKFKKLSDTAITPCKAHANDAGFDLFSDENITTTGGDKVTIKTGIALELPDGYMADVRPRSGITSKTKLRVQYGTVDAGYRGEISIIVDNIGSWYDFENIEEGMKLAQLVIQKIPDVQLIEADELNDTVRGNGGFGSTGN